MAFGGRQGAAAWLARAQATLADAEREGQVSRAPREDEAVTP